MALNSSIIRLWRTSGLFLAVVAGPSLAAALYLGLMASDVYISESRFVVRSAERAEAPSLGALIKGGAAPASDNTYVAQEYILSREALAAVETPLKLRQEYAAADIDVVSRFPGLLLKDNSETFFEHYRKHVSVQVDPSSSVSALTVRAYTPELAQALNRELLAQAEALVNKLNSRMREDLANAARAEVSHAEDRVRLAEEAILAFRGAHGLVNPEQQAALQLQHTEKLRETLLQAESRLEQVRAVAKDSPQIPALQRQVAVTRQAIRAADTATTAATEQSLISSSALYQRLGLERELAAKQLAFAMERLDRAQTEVSKKQVYLERIAEPSLPDGALEPHRIRAFLSTLIVSLLLYGVLTVLAAGIREHREII